MTIDVGKYRKNKHLQEPQKLFLVMKYHISFIPEPSLEKTIIQDLVRQVKGRKYLPAPKNIFMFPDILTTSAVTVVYVQNSAPLSSRRDDGWQGEQKRSGAKMPSSGWADCKAMVIFIIFFMIQFEGARAKLAIIRAEH